MRTCWLLRIRSGSASDVRLRWSAEDAEVLAERIGVELGDDAVEELGPLPVALRLVDSDREGRIVLQVRFGRTAGRVHVHVRGALAKLLDDLPLGTEVDPIELPEPVVLALAARLTASR